MAFDADLLELMPHELVFTPPGAAPLDPIRARIELGWTEVASADPPGSFERSYGGTIFLGGHFADVVPGSRVDVPSQLGVMPVRVTEIAVEEDDDGPHHDELTVTLPVSLRIEFETVAVIRNVTGQLNAHGRPTGKGLASDPIPATIVEGPTDRDEQGAGQSTGSRIILDSSAWPVHPGASISADGRDWSAVSAGRHERLGTSWVDVVAREVTARDVAV